MRPIDADFAKEQIKKSDLSNREKMALLLFLSDVPTITPPPNDPLTLEELREMDGEPVYVHWVRRDWRMGGEWAFVCLKWQGCKTANGGAVFFDRYGEWWLAYRRKPEEGETCPKR